MDFPSPLLLDGVWLIYTVLLVLAVLLVLVMIKAVLSLVRLLHTLNSYWHLRTEARQHDRVDRYFR